jgi:hypothetical protein
MGPAVVLNGVTRMGAAVAAPGVITREERVASQPLSRRVTDWWIKVPADISTGKGWASGVP